VEDRPLDDDDALVARAKRGDRRAFETIVERNQGIVFRTAWLITRSREDAQEVAQEAFLKAYRALGRFRQGAPLRPWLLTIAANEARNRRVASSRRERLTLRGAELLAAVERLRETDRLVIACRYFLELSEHETAAVLGWRRGTVKSRLARALERLRFELGGSELRGEGGA
jgi:RNA polymerase sigma-70 factor, ECF subfamily